jgi:hypothetical protein
MRKELLEQMKLRNEMNKKIEQNNEKFFMRLEREVNKIDQNTSHLKKPGEKINIMIR